ncbi:hypothetical protein J4461_02300 [Candidatus Pacearchaeota archaeon]|nr:hypothetical protein [Candidatus Pacearchaeota archaeon]
MAEKEVLIKEKIEHEGIFNFKDFYKYSYQWFKDEQYGGLVEEKYQEKVTPAGREILVEWKLGKKLSDYFKIEISIKIEVFGLQDVEAEIDGKKKKTNKGNLRMEIKGMITKDPNSNWESPPLYKFLREIYDKYVIPGRIDGVEDIVTSDVKDFKEALKAFLELQGRRS